MDLAVSIGVGGAHGLPALAGVKSGVDRFARWAEGQGFRVVRHEDCDGDVVDAGDIFDTIREGLRDGSAQRLVVYFAGHGQGTGGDTWLLTDAVENPNAGINVSLSVDMARQSGVPHVVFFGDACRSTAARQVMNVRGSAIFPSLRRPGPTRVDVFFGTRLGEQAYEVDDGVDAFGLFTDELLRVLEGGVPATIHPVSDDPPLDGIPAADLRSHLEAELPRRVERVIGFPQYPDVRVDSTWRPHVVARLPRDRAGLGEPNAPRAIDGSIIIEATVNDPNELVERDAPSVARLFGVLVDRGLEDQPRFASGLPASEAHAATTLVAHYRAELDGDEYGAYPTRDPDKPSLGYLEASDARWAISSETLDELDPSVASASAAASVVCRTGSGDSWAGVAIFPGFRTMLVDEGRGMVRTVFLPLVSHFETSVAAEETAVLIAASRLGRIGEYLAHEGPTVLDLDTDVNAILATAYWKFDTGRTGEVVDLAWRLVDEVGWLPFDVAMLAEVEIDPELVRPSFPLMSRGWALLDRAPIEPTLRETLDELSPGLVAGPTTTFAPTIADDALYRLVGARLRYLER